jgi:hypothetical protein
VKRPTRVVLRLPEQVRRESDYDHARKPALGLLQSELQTGGLYDVRRRERRGRASKVLLRISHEKALHAANSHGGSPVRGNNGLRRETFLKGAVTSVKEIEHPLRAF